MAKQFLHHLGMNTETQQEGGGAMAQIVKTNVWQLRSLQQLLELIDNVVGSEMRTRERAENVIVILPAFTCLDSGPLPDAGGAFARTRERKKRW